MTSLEHKEDHQNDHVDLLRTQEQALLGGEIGVYDARFIAILYELLEEGQITSWRRSSDNSREDQAGIDYSIRIGNDKIPFQITGSYRQAGYRKVKHPDIPVIHLMNRREPGLKSPELTKKEILMGAETYLNK